MRIAVPVSNDRTAETLSGIEGFQFFEDDHGRIVRTRFFCHATTRSRIRFISSIKSLLPE